MATAGYGFPLLLTAIARPTAGHGVQTCLVDRETAVETDGGEIFTSLDPQKDRLKVRDRPTRLLELPNPGRFVVGVISGVHSLQGMFFG